MSPIRPAHRIQVLEVADGRVLAQGLETLRAIDTPPLTIASLLQRKEDRRTRHSLVSDEEHRHDQAKAKDTEQSRTPEESQHTIDAGVNRGIVIKVDYRHKFAAVRLREERQWLRNHSDAAFETEGEALAVKPGAIIKDLSDGVMRAPQEQDPID